MTYRPFTLIVPYYRNPAMFVEQQRIWCGLDPDVRAALHVIVVDDGSPLKGAALPMVQEKTKTALASFRLFRTGVDVRWNWLFCRNLGAEKAKTDWLLMTDIDHVIPNETWRRLMREKLRELFVYRLSRVTTRGETLHPHPNTWIFTRHMFWNRIEGYDERFSGYYGTDGEFTRRVESWAQQIEILPDVAILYDNTVIRDASTTAYTRKEDYDRKNVREIREARKHERWTPKRVSFPWTQLI